MSVHYYWANDAHTVMVYEFAPGWVWTDLYAMMHNGVYPLLAQTPHQVDFVVDITRASIFPRDAHTHLLRLHQVGVENPQTRDALLIYVGARPPAKMLILMLRSAIPKMREQLCFEDSMEAAFNRINIYRNRLRAG